MAELKLQLLLVVVVVGVVGCCGLLLVIWSLLVVGWLAGGWVVVLWLVGCCWDCGY